MLRGSLTPARLDAHQAACSEFEGWTGLVSEALEARSEWARTARFPDYDKAHRIGGREPTGRRLIEGSYEDEKKGKQAWADKKRQRGDDLRRQAEENLQRLVDSDNRRGAAGGQTGPGDSSTRHWEKPTWS